MSQTEILIKLRELHEALAAINQSPHAEQIDEATIDALGQLITDAGSIVDQHREQSSGLVSDSNPPLMTHDDLLSRIQRFDSKHPRVGQFLSQVTDLLGMMGI